MFLSEEVNKFLEYLTYQIEQKNKFNNLIKRKVPIYRQLEECDHNIVTIIDKFEKLRRRDIYSTLVQEFTHLINKY